MLAVADCDVVSQQNDMVELSSSRLKKRTRVTFSVMSMLYQQTVKVHLPNLVGFLQAVPALLQLRDNVSSYRCRNSDGFPANTFRNGVPQKCALLLSHHIQIQWSASRTRSPRRQQRNQSWRRFERGRMIEKKLLALFVRLRAALASISLTTSRLQ